MAKIDMEDKDGFVTVRMNNGVTNAIDPELLAELDQALDSLDDTCKGLLLAGGDKFFSMGFNLPELLALDREGFSNFFYLFNGVTLKLLSLDLPTCCAVSGHAVAGDNILAIACDVRVAGAGCKLGLNEILLGLPVPFLADLRLQQLVGVHQATRMVLGGDFMDSEHALSLGLVDEMVGKTEVAQRATETLTAMMSLPRAAYAATKRYRTEPVREAYEKACKIKNDTFIDCWFRESAQQLLTEAAKKF